MQIRRKLRCYCFYSEEEKGGRRGEKWLRWYHGGFSGGNIDRLRVRAAESRSSSRLSVEALSLRTHSLSPSPSFVHFSSPRRTPSSFQGGSLRGRSIRSEVRPRALRRLPQPPSSSVSSDATPETSRPRVCLSPFLAASTSVDRMAPSTSCFLPTAALSLLPAPNLLTANRSKSIF